MQYFFRMYRTVLFWLLLFSSFGGIQASPVVVIGHEFDQSAFEAVLPSITNKYDLDIRFKTLPEPYTLNTEYELIYNPNVSIVDLLSPSMLRFDNANWLSDLSDYDRIFAASSKQYKSLDTAKYKNGRLIGLGHNTMLTIIPLIEMAGYKQMGLDRDDFPTSWDSLYQQVLELANNGHKNFFSPAWFDHNHGIALSFLVELWNRDADIIDGATLDAFPGDSRERAVQILENWRKVWEAGAVPEKVLSQSFEEFQKAYWHSSLPISVRGSATLINAKNVGRPEKNLVTILPREQQNWGTPLSSIQTLIKRSDSEVPATPEFISMFLDINRGSGEGLYKFAEISLDQNGLLSTYKEFMDSQSAREILERKLPFSSDIEVLMDIYENSIHESYWNIAWHEELTEVLMIELKQYLLNSDISPLQVIEKITSEAGEIKATYGY